MIHWEGLFLTVFSKLKSLGSQETDHGALPTVGLWKSLSTTHLCLQMSKTPRQISNGSKGSSVLLCSSLCSILPCSLVHPCSSNVDVYKINSHHHDSDSDEPDGGYIGLEMYRDFWMGIDPAKRAVVGRKGKYKFAAEKPNGFADQTGPRPKGFSSIVPRIKKPKKLNDQKSGSFFTKTVLTKPCKAK